MKQSAHTGWLHYPTHQVARPIEWSERTDRSWCGSGLAHAARFLGADLGAAPIFGAEWLFVTPRDV